jgi:hypothetical protein
MKKRMLFFVFIVGLFLAGFASAVIPDDCDFSMAAYWKMDGDATDSLPGGADGSGWPEGVSVLKVGTAANFIGGDGITVSSVNIFQAGFTVEMWIQKDGAPVSNSILFRKGNYVIEYLDNNTIRASIESVSIDSGVLAINTPHYVALTWEPVMDPANEALALYIDGSRVDFAALASPGAHAGALDMGDGFVGLMDEVAVYDRAFDSSEIGTHYVLSDSGRDYCDASGVGSSTTKADFNIAGCSLPSGGGIVVDSCSRGEIAGEYYCDSGRNLLETRELNYGCSRGLAPAAWALGDPYCCPSGMLCNETGGAFKCDYRLEQCWNQTDESDCKAIGCTWLDEEGLCADGTRDYPCSLYDTQSECETDVWNLGTTGVGTEFCGASIDCGDTMYTIPYESCECRWNAVAEVCDLYMEGGETYYDNAATREWFSCSKDYVLGDCTEGEQDVSWTASSTINNGFDSDCLDMMGCSDGSSTRLCGEPVVRLPGFSLFALFVSVFIIGLYYYRRF